MVAATSTSQTLSSLQLEELNLTGRVRLTVRRNVGGFSDVYTGVFEEDGEERLVAVKELRACGNVASDNEYDRLLIHLYREIAVWKKLQHDHITPLLGFTADPDFSPCLVSPWFTNGNVMTFLKTNPDADRLGLLLDAAKGLAYLHSLRLVHGDIKAENILVDDNQTAQLCDFGLSKFIDETNHITGLTTTTPMPGTIRFLAPELLDDVCPKTTMSDVWAFGCVGIQIITSRTPYQHLSRIQSVIYAIIKGESPMPASHVEIYEFEVELWPIVQRCWRSNASKRPTIKHLESDIERIYLAANPPSIGAMATNVAAPLLRTIATDRPPPTSCGPGSFASADLDIASEDERTVTGLEMMSGAAQPVESENVTLKSFQVLRVGGTRVWRDVRSRGEKNKQGKQSNLWSKLDKSHVNWRSRYGLRNGHSAQNLNSKGSIFAQGMENLYGLESDQQKNSIGGKDNHDQENRSMDSFTNVGGYKYPGHGSPIDPGEQRHSKSLPITHGDTKGSNVLGDENKTTIIASSDHVEKGTLNKFTIKELIHQDPNIDHRNLDLWKEGRSQSLPGYQQKSNDRSERNWSIYGQNRLDGKMHDWKMPTRSCTVEALYGLNLGVMSPIGGQDSWNQQHSTHLGGHYDPTMSQGYPYGGDYRYTQSGHQEIFV